MQSMREYANLFIKYEEKNIQMYENVHKIMQKCTYFSKKQTTYCEIMQYFFAEVRIYLDVCKSIQGIYFFLQNHIYINAYVTML